MDDLLSGIVGAGQSIFNLINSERDRRYQQNLQETMFQREDNAVQRRMADLNAAGLNPNLAAGSAAQAGSVVGRSETPKQDFGSFLDTISAVNQIKQQKQAVKNAEEEGKILKYKKDEEAMNSALMQANLFNQLGLPFAIKVGVKDGNFTTSFISATGGKGYDWNSYEDMPLTKDFNAQLNYALTAADLLQRDAEWYTADKVSGLVLNLLGTGANLKRVFK